MGTVPVTWLKGWVCEAGAAPRAVRAAEAVVAPVPGDGTISNTENTLVAKKLQRRIQPSLYKFFNRFAASRNHFTVFLANGKPFPRHCHFYAKLVPLPFNSHIRQYIHRFRRSKGPAWARV